MECIDASSNCCIRKIVHIFHDDSHTVIGMPNSAFITRENLDIEMIMKEFVLLSKNLMGEKVHFTEEGSIT